MRRWDPTHYEEFLAERLQPGLDLIARIPGSPMRIADLGCGTGRLTAQLARLWPQATVVGIDRSESMLKSAASGPTFEVGDIQTWEPDEPVDLIYANASLHWIDDHATLFPRLATLLSPGGCLAVQMPLSWDQPSHRAIRDVGRDFGIAIDDPPTLDPSDYHQVMAPHVEKVEVWLTTYYHLLSGDNPVFRWVSATGMKRFLNRIESAQHDAYLALCAERIRSAYPARPDGTTLFPFTRLFILAARQGGAVGSPDAH